MGVALEAKLEPELEPALELELEVELEIEVERERNIEISAVEPQNRSSAIPFRLMRIPRRRQHRRPCVGWPGSPCS